MQRGRRLGSGALVGFALVLSSSAVAQSYNDPASFEADLLGVRNAADFDGFAPGAQIVGGANAERITWTYDLDGAQAIVVDAFDTPSPGNALGLTGGDDALLDGDRITLGFPSPVLAVGLHVVTSDPALAGEVLLTGDPTGSVTSAAAPLQILPDGGHVYFLGLISATPLASATLDFAADGEVNFLYNLDAVTTAAPQVTTWTLSGTAQGGFIDFTVEGVALHVLTSPGQTADQVAASIAAAINGAVALQNAGIVAEASGPEVGSNGLVSGALVADAGLSSEGVPLPSPVPALPSWGRWTLALLLTAAGGRIHPPSKKGCPS